MAAGGPLAGRLVAVPESRELDLFAGMLEQRGAATLRCPLVAIREVPDPAPILAWLDRFSGGGCDALVLMTGEGLRRLLGVARGAGLEPAFIARLGAVTRITRGPKPARALRELGLRPDLTADPPTTEGVIAAMAARDWRGRRIGLQLYPDNPNAAFLDFAARAGATVDPVLPYIYAAAADDRRVEELIDRLADGSVDLIAFTSTPQISRLVAVAEAGGRTPMLRDGLARGRVAAVGPVVAAALARLGIRVDLVPPDNFFLKPLVNGIVALLGAA